MRKLILLLLLMASSLTHGQTPTNMSGLEIANKTSPNKTVFAPTRAASCSTLTNQLVGSQCFDTTTKTLYTCSTINSSGSCTSWVVAGAAAQGSAGAVQASAGGGLLADSGVTATAGVLTAKQVNAIRYANQYATGGAGTTVSPWTGWESCVTGIGSTGGVCEFPTGYYYTSSPVVIPYDGIVIRGQVNVNRGGVNNNGAVVHAAGGGSWSGDAIFKGTGINGVTIRDLKITGTGTTSANAILAVGGNRWTIENVFTDQFTGPCVYLKNDGGSNVTGRLSNIWSENCVKGTSLGVKTGAIQVEWTDTYIDSVTGSTSSSDYSESGNRVGVLLSGSFNFLVNSVGHLSEDGIALSGTFNRVSNCRADLNRGNGFVITGGSNAISNSLSMNNSQQTDNTYDGFYVATGTNNTFMGNTNAYNLTNKVRYAFNDASGSQANVWVGNYSPASNYGTSEYANTSVGRWFGPSTSTGFAGEIRGSLKVGDPNSSTEYARFTFPGSAAVANFGFSKSNLSWAFDYDGTLNYSADPFVTNASFAAQSFVLKPSAAYSGNRVTVTAATPTAAQTATFPDASGTVVLDPNTTPPTTAAGYYQSGDSKGMQFFPGVRRSYTEVVSLLKRSETNNTAGDSNAFVFIGDSILSMSTRSALRTLDKRFRIVPGYIPISSTLNYASAPDVTLDATTGTWTVYGNNGGSETVAANRQQFGVDGGSYKATSAASWGITSNVAVNKARIWYLKMSGGGTFNYCTTAGCTPGTTINTSNASDDAGHVDISFSKYTPGNVVRLAWASGTVYIYGVELYATFSSSEDQNDILEPIFLTHGGNLLDSTSGGGFSTYASSNPIWSTFYTTIAPSSIVVFLGTNDACRTRGGGATNDCLTGRTSTQYSTDYQTLLTALLAATPKKTDIILTTVPARGYDDCSGEMPGFKTLADQYRTATFTLATTNGLSVWDLRKYWPGFTDANSLGLYSGDCTHPSAIGQALISGGYGNIITPSEGWKPRRNYIEDDCGTYASSSTVTLLNRKCSYADVTGSTAITTLSGPAGENLCQSETRGRQIKLGCASGATWTIAAGGAGNIKLNSPWTCTDNRALTLTCDGSAASGNWIATGLDSPSTFMSCQSWWFGSATGSVADNMRSNGGSGAYLFHPVPKASTFRSVSCVSDGGTTGGTITVQFCTPGNAGCGDGQVVLSAGSTANTAYTGTSCSSNCTTAANSTYVMKITTSGVTSTTNINCNVCTAMVPW